MKKIFIAVFTALMIFNQGLCATPEETDLHNTSSETICDNNSKSNNKTEEATFKNNNDSENNDKPSHLSTVKKIIGGAAIIITVFYITDAILYPSGHVMFNLYPDYGADHLTSDIDAKSVSRFYAWFYDLGLFKLDKDKTIKDYDVFFREAANFLGRKAAHIKHLQARKKYLGSLTSEQDKFLSDLTTSANNIQSDLKAINPESLSKLITKIPQN